MNPELKSSVLNQAKLLSDVLSKYSDVAENGRSAEALLAAGKIWELSGCSASARDCYHLAIEGGACEPELLARMVVVNLKLRNAEHAREVCLTLKKQAPDAVFPNLLGFPISTECLMGDVLYNLGDLKGAEDAYQKALRLEANDVHALSQLAQLLVEAGKLGDAKGLIAGKNLEPGREPLRALVESHNGNAAGISNVRFGNFKVYHDA
jgi:tetratricopeptide (TPR) repeat protein